MSRQTSPLRESLALLTVGLWLRQITLALAVFLLAILWMRLPDASAFEVALSALLALAVLALAGAGESAILLRLTAQRPAPRRLLRGTLALLLGCALWLALYLLLDRSQSGDYLRAGYWNSRFPAAWRNFFSYAHLVLWQEWLRTILDCLWTGIVAAGVLALTAARNPLRAFGFIMRRIVFWAALFFAAFAAIVLTTVLLSWTPGHGLRAEILSLILRLALLLAADGALLCFFLAVVAACILRAETPPLPYIVPAGTPEPSQPRTVVNP